MFPSMFPSFLLQYVISHANIYFMLNSGVDRLVDNQSYTAAYPLHEVSKFKNSVWKQDLKCLVKGYCSVTSMNDRPANLRVAEIVSCILQSREIL